MLGRWVGVAVRLSSGVVTPHHESGGGASLRLKGFEPTCDLRARLMGRGECICEKEDKGLE